MIVTKYFLLYSMTIIHAIALILYDENEKKDKVYIRIQSIICVYIIELETYLARSRSRVSRGRYPGRAAARRRSRMCNGSACSSLSSWRWASSCRGERRYCLLQLFSRNFFPVTWNARPATIRLLPRFARCTASKTRHYMFVLLSGTRCFVSVTRAPPTPACYCARPPAATAAFVHHRDLIDRTWHSLQLCFSRYAPIWKQTDNHIIRLYRMSMLKIAMAKSDR